MVIYQVLTRLFGNNGKNVKNGTITQNGCSKMADFTNVAFDEIKKLGTTHIWYTGIIEHATKSDYSKYGITPNHSGMIKGNAGSPYAIKDYYDVNPDIAVDVDRRIQEFEELVKRTHKSGLKVVIDFVPNHVAREYHSDKKPKGVKDFGVNDIIDWHFYQQNNFYYFPHTNLKPSFDCNGYSEYPAKATGNDCFSPNPSVSDWYETVKLNYGVDYCGGNIKNFEPIPNTWEKMVDILTYWAKKGVDGFRCDMAEMVPVEFWNWAIAKIKKSFPNIIFIAEVYNPDLYRSYIFDGGFDYLYDKVGLYDTLKEVVRGEKPASSITSQWQATNDIESKMLNFLENHDEQRLASSFFAGDSKKGKPALMVSALLNKSPFMLYFGQELGEKGEDNEGFSGLDGRTTIFDYWSVDTIKRWANKGSFDGTKLKKQEKELQAFYQNILSLKESEMALSNGIMYDLMWFNYNNPNFDTSKQFAWIRKFEKDTILIIANFSDENAKIELAIGEHAFDFLGMNQKKKVEALELLKGKIEKISFNSIDKINITVPKLSGVILKLED